MSKATSSPRYIPDKVNINDRDGACLDILFYNTGLTF